MKKDYVSQVFCIKIDGEGVPLKLNENWATTIFNAFTDLYDQWWLLVFRHSTA